MDLNQISQYVPYLIPLLVLDLVLKGVGLWNAAKNNQKYWFVALFVINTAGLLPAIYLIFFQQKGKTK